MKADQKGEEAMKLLQSTAGRIAIALMVILVLNVVSLAAQGTDVTVVAAPQLTSVGAVVLFSIFGTWVVKRLFVNVPVMNQVPVWVYVCVLAIAFTFLANKVIGSLEGNFWALAWAGIYNGAAASGFREWVYNDPTKSMEKSVGGR